MPPTLAAATITDGYRQQLALLRDTAADALAGLLSDIDLDVRPGSLDRQLTAWADRALTLVRAGGEQAGALSIAYVPAYITAGGGEAAAELAPAAVRAPDLTMVRSALLWRLGRYDGRGAAMHTATGTARRIARTTVATTAASTLATAYEAEPAVDAWHRVTSSHCCSRCAEAARQSHPASTPFRLRHPADRCTPEGVLVGIPERLVRRAPTVVTA